MGRLQHLTRLALGRSAYQAAADDNDDEDLPGLVSENVEIDQTTSQPADGQYIQQYDSNGRPTNPATEARNAEMRRAQNSIMALVGVVESRDNSARANESMYRHIREARRELLKAEHSHGENLDSLASIIAPSTTWWIDCLLMRFTIGLYGVKTPFLDVLGQQWRSLVSGGLKGVYSTVFPGVVAYLAYTAARVCIALVVEDGVNRLSEIFSHPGMHRKTQKRLDTFIRYAMTGLFLATDAPLLPLYYYTTAQQLGLAPAFPLLPPVRSLLPWHPTSPHAYAWKPTTGVPFLRIFSSPAVLLLAMKLLELNAEPHFLVGNDSTSFACPAVHESSTAVSRPVALRDPLGWVLYQSYCLRSKAMQWCNWKGRPAGTSRSDESHETDVSLNLGATSNITERRMRRATKLAYLPAVTLATTIDTLLERLLTLPFAAITYRALATSYMSSPFPKTAQAVVAGPTLYAPYSGAFVGLLRSPGLAASSATELAYYASKLGLTLALRISIDAAFFAGVYKVVRWQGIRYFDWGSRSEIGGIIYATPPSSP